MAMSREGHSSTLLGTNNVLICGGSNSSYSIDLASCELYNTSSGAFIAIGKCARGSFGFLSLPSFSAKGSMSTPRNGHTGTLLGSSDVLICGGLNITVALASCDLYSASSGTFVVVGNPVCSFRFRPSITFAVKGNMSIVRWHHTATLLTSGDVLLCGGSNFGTEWASCELYNVTSKVFVVTGIIGCIYFCLFIFFFLLLPLAGSMSTARSDHTATLLASNTVIMCGGHRSSTTWASCELYNTSSGAFVGIGRTFLSFFLSFLSFFLSQVV